MSWLRVTWTEAAQVLPLCAEEMPPLTKSDQTPQDYFTTELLGEDRMDLAVGYLGAALPRLEAVQWATETIAHAGTAAGLPRNILASVKAWLADPSEPRRRETWALAQQDEESSPARLLAAAVFFSGGSIAPEDCEPVQPDPTLCGRLAAAAILATAYRGKEPEAVMRFAVTEGDRIASS